MLDDQMQRSAREVYISHELDNRRVEEIRLQAILVWYWHHANYVLPREDWAPTPRCVPLARAVRSHSLMTLAKRYVKMVTR
jgi:hypothetical protein